MSTTDGVFLGMRKSTDAPQVGSARRAAAKKRGDFIFGASPSKSNWTRVFSSGKRQMAENMWDQTCRTCLATCGELVPIFSNDYYVRNLPDKLFHTTRIEVLKNDNLPKMICKKCIFLVDSLYCFKDQCEMAEIKLKKSLKGAADGDRTYDSYILATDHSDAVSSSDEEYHIEYASEEARLEVEKARKRNRTPKSRLSRNSGVKVKSVQVLPAESKEFCQNVDDAESSYKFQFSEIEDVNVSDSDTLYVSEESKRSVLNCMNNYDEPKYVTSEKSQFLKDKSESMKPKLKRKMDSDNNYNQLTKVPKKVMFKDTEEDLQFIEVSDNQDRMQDDYLLKETNDENNTVVQINVIENSTGKIVQNYDIPVCKETPVKNSTESLVSFEFTKKSPDENVRKILETRMKSLIRQVILDIPQVCDICTEFFDSYQDVVKHKAMIHMNMNDEYFYCPVCQDKFFSNTDLMTHIDKHKDAHSYICSLCSCSLHTEDTMRSHLLSHINLRELKCELCARRFQRIQTLLNHCDTHLRAKELTCVFCSTVLNNKESLQKHINEFHKRPAAVVESQCEVCGLRLPESEKEEHAKTHTTYPCPYCERSFSIKANLRDHVYTHLGVQPYTCLVCEKAFDSQEERTQHMQEHMKPPQKPQLQKVGDQKKFRCRVCHEILVSRAAYGQHLKEKHWNSKQTAEILRELSESCMNEKLNETLTNDSSYT
ncbi:hypothetical protein TSAR_014245 [Trichomalopsis sarcophagae]|uniref:Protein krueppel n=1 Tax=Trichomalopsis sarcophagae TaxID=543379 RepID=A0A232FKW4_9HYME|nr:hypothetical protein TSAR_014245 [Trichomalopsis sarcophagae]